jgi:hypothetical protein
MRGSFGSRILTLKVLLTSNSGAGSTGAMPARVVPSQLGKLELWMLPSHSSPRPPSTTDLVIQSIHSGLNTVLSASLVTNRS